MSEFDFRCGPLLSAGTASVSLPWQRVCRRCSQRTVLVDQPLTLCLRLLVTLRSMLPRHKGTKKFTQVVPSLRGLRTRAIPANVFGGSSNRRPRSHRPPLTRTGKAIYGRILYHFIQLKKSVVGKRYTSSRIHEDSCGRRGIDETPQCASTRRLSSRPRKAKCIRAA